MRPTYRATCALIGVVIDWCVSVSYVGHITDKVRKIPIGPARGQTEREKGKRWGQSVDPECGMHSTFTGARDESDLPSSIDSVNHTNRLTSSEALIWHPLPRRQVVPVEDYGQALWSGDTWIVIYVQPLVPGAHSMRLRELP